MAKRRRRSGSVVHEGAVVFGPAFFGEALPAMVRSCPCPEGSDVACFLHLIDGTTLDVVQVLALTDRFCVLAVLEGEGDDGVERTEDDVGMAAVPYELVARASIRPLRRRATFGFRLAESPPVGTEEAVEPLLARAVGKRKKKPARRSSAD